MDPPSTVTDLLVRCANEALELQRSDGSFPPGQNGAYNEPETPVRTTSHWLTTLSKVLEITDNSRIFEAANDAADYLLSDDTRPHGYTFQSRKTETKDKADGLIGQAAPIRGLARASDVLGRPELFDCALSVFLMHPFDDRLGLWERVEIDGRPLSFDRTFNHQITFVAACLDIHERNEEVTRRIRCFLDRLETNMRVQSDGLINHYIRPAPRDALSTVLHDGRHWPLFLNELAVRYYSHLRSRRDKEVGYFPINLYGLARLKENFPEHDVWQAQSIERIIAFAESAEYERHVMENPHGSMVPGIQTAYGLSVLADLEPTAIAEWVSRDIETRFDHTRGLFVSNATDPAFQAATVYNATTLPNVTLQTSISADGG